MKVRIKRIDPTLPLPEYKTSGSVAFDLYARVETTIAAKTIALIPTNVIIETPPGMMLLVATRSSTPMRTGLILANGVGIIDQDYCGAKDEILMQLYNITDAPVTVARGDRIGQALFLPMERVEFEEIGSMDRASRGGIGSTGHV